MRYLTFIMRAIGLAVLAAILLFARAAAAVAQTSTPTPAPTTTPAAQAAPVWHNPPNTNFAIFDPCGGPKELLNKFGPTPCVYIAGEAMVSAGYSNISTHGSIVASHGAVTRSFPISGNANVYPSLLLVVGVSPSSQLQITAPSDVEVNTARFGSYSAASDTSFNYKQRLFFSPTAYTQLAIDLGYTAPTNGGGITSPGPSYQVQLDLAQPIGSSVSVGPWWTFVNSASTSPGLGTTRGWSDPLGIWFAWSPPNSSFEVLPVIYHTFNPNRTAVLGQFVQLLSRHFSVALTYGGTETSTQSNGPFSQTFSFAANSSPRIVGVNLYYLINESNLPPAPPAAPAPTATPTSPPPCHCH